MESTSSNHTHVITDEKQAAHILKQIIYYLNVTFTHSVANEEMIETESKIKELFSLAEGTAKSAQDYLRYHARNPKNNLLIEHYTQAFMRALDQVSIWQEQNQQKAQTMNYSQALSDLAKQDNAPVLSEFIKRNNRFLKLNDLNLALRIAADNGRDDNIGVLVKQAADILSYCSQSGWLAIHFAIKKGHQTAALALLKSMDTWDDFAPCKQLTTPDKNRQTALDLLDSLTDPTVKFNLSEAILDIVSDSYYSENPDNEMLKLNVQKRLYKNIQENAHSAENKKSNHRPK